jgi:hypothetical protein
MLTPHSAISGGATCFAGSGVRPNFSNLFTYLPEQLPMPTSSFASPAPGMAITASRVFGKAAWL